MDTDIDELAALRARHAEAEAKHAQRQADVLALILRAVQSTSYAGRLASDANYPTRVHWVAHTRPHSPVPHLTWCGFRIRGHAGYILPAEVWLPESRQRRTLGRDDVDCKACLRHLAAGRPRDPHGLILPLSTPPLVR